jgi:excisionase family DNA binding protein
VTEVARLLGVAKSTVYGLVTSGRIRHVRISNAIRVAPEWLAPLLRPSNS